MDGHGQVNHSLALVDDVLVRREVVDINIPHHVRGTLLSRHNSHGINGLWFTCMVYTVMHMHAWVAFCTVVVSAWLRKDGLHCDALTAWLPSALI